ncbi:MAG: hypothetical protein RXR16_08485, partial [Thermocladium sp.]
LNFYNPDNYGFALMYRLYGVMSGMRGLEVMLLVIIEELYGIYPFSGIYVFSSLSLVTLTLFFAILSLFDYLVGPINVKIGVLIFIIDMAINAWLLYTELAQLYSVYLVTLLVVPLSNLLVDALASLVIMEAGKP